MSRVKIQKSVPAPLSHGTHKCSSQTLAPTLCTPQLRKGECLIAAEECEAHLVHFPNGVRENVAFDGIADYILDWSYLLESSKGKVF